MDVYVELYVACNPPLLPRGVSEVIRRVQGPEELAEILYEPHVPCFKCIVRSGYEQQIYATIQDNLFAIAEDDIDALDAEDDTGADISILDPDSRFAPWSEYTRAGSEAYEWADGDVFPEPIVESSYKTVWRGLQQRTNIRFEQLLDRCHKLLGYLAASPTPEQFENSTECQICYNSHQNILYIGSDKNKEDIEQIVEKLNALVDIQACIGLVEHHIILDSEDSPYAAYKWASHLGFHRSTYLPYHPRSTENSCSVLMTSAMIRLKTLNSYGKWVPEQARSIPKQSTEPNPAPKPLNRGYKINISNHLLFSQNTEASPVNENNNNVMSWRDEVRELSTSPKENPAAGLSPLVNGSLWSNSSEDLLGDIPCEINSTLQRSIRLFPGKGRDATTDTEDLISFDDTDCRPSIQEEATTPANLSTTSEEPRDISSNDTSTGSNISTDSVKRSQTNNSKVISSVEIQRWNSEAAACIYSSQSHLEEAIRSLALLPGHVQIRLEFGRLFLYNIPDLLVDFDQTLDFPVATILHQLRHCDQDRIRFAPILSPKEEDMYKLVKITPQGAYDWEQFQNKVYYDLHCEFGQDANCAVVRVDPEKGISCQSTPVEFLSTYLHCPKHDWDMKLAGYQHFDLTLTEKSWLEAWLESSKLSNLEKGGLRIEFLDRPGNLATVKGIVIRHVLVYKQPDLDVDLTITLSRKLNKTAVGAQTAGSMVPVTWQTPKNSQHSRPTPDEWVEASLGSAVVNKLISGSRHDREKSFGSRGTRDLEVEITSLAKVTSFGGDMVKEMNVVGTENNNGQNLDMKGVISQQVTSSQYRLRNSATKYW